VTSNLQGITGVNISVHYYDLEENEEVVGIWLDESDFLLSIPALKQMNSEIRLNCNCIKGYIDSKSQIEEYLLWAKSIGVCSVRFAELKRDDEKFVDLGKIMDYRYGLNDDPFVYGCWKETVIGGVRVNFRQMCGLQAPNQRPVPTDPVLHPKQVLYYDGIIYDGWQPASPPPSHSPIDEVEDDEETGSGCHY
jgi:hypothetical protein